MTPVGLNERNSVPDGLLVLLSVNVSGSRERLTRLAVRLWWVCGRMTCLCVCMYVWVVAVVVAKAAAAAAAAAVVVVVCMGE
jgi:hypothetical protein